MAGPISMLLVVRMMASIAIIAGFSHGCDQKVKKRVHSSAQQGSGDQAGQGAGDSLPGAGEPKKKPEDEDSRSAGDRDDSGRGSTAPAAGSSSPVGDSRPDHDDEKIPALRERIG